MSRDSRYLHNLYGDAHVRNVNDYETFATTTTSKSGTVPIVGSMVLITAIGDDHFVDFEKQADETSLIVAKGTTQAFDIDAIPNTMTVSARAVNTAGHVCISFPH